MYQKEMFLAVQRMQNYIEEHLSEKITLKELSNAAGYSSWHAARIFKELTGKTPFEYIRSLRLSKAAITLRDSRNKIIDVALDFVFDSHEGFTRAFAREFGIRPKKYSEKTPPIQLFLPDDAIDMYHAFYEGGKSMEEKKISKAIFIQVMERPERKALIKRGKTAEDYFQYCEEEGCEVWGLLTSVKEALYEPVGMWLPKALIKEGTSKYVQGVELPMDYANEIPEGFELIELPACSMMIFQGEPFEDKDFMDAIDEVWKHIEGFQPNVYGYEWAPEAAPRFQLCPMGYRGYIEGLPVVPVNQK